MGLTAEVKEVEIEVTCDNCESNDFVRDFDCNNQHFGEALKPQVEDGWVFKQDARWAQSGDKPSTICRYLFCFCDEDCFKEYLQKEKEEASEYVDVDYDELGAYEARFDEDVEVSR